MSQSSIDKSRLRSELDIMEMEQHVKSKGHWENQYQFFFSLVGYSVGLISIWRFPYVCMDNGGGAFLVPFTIFLLLCGIPMFYLELVIGQYSGYSPTEVWAIAPLLKGIGYGMVLLSGVVCVYYNVVISWSLHFIANSFRATLPWTTCVNSTWASEFCVDDKYSANVTMNNTHAPADDYFHNSVLQITPSISEWGGMQWELVACLAVAWVFVFLCLFQGVKVAGSVAYVTATVPYLFLTILLVVGVTREGSADGLRYFLEPDFSKLANFNIWFAACVQVFFTLGPSWGGLITLASYNKFHHNCLRDALVVPTIVLITSIYGGLVVFSILGHLAWKNGVDVPDVVAQGPGLVFTVYPEAVKLLPMPQIWSVIFFLMILTLGIDSQFGLFETLLTGVQDTFPVLRSHKRKLAAALAMFSFMLGLPFVSKFGMYLLYLVDFYVAAFSVLVLACMECTAIAWLYGVDRLLGNIEDMLHRKQWGIWRYLWKYVTPTILTAVLVVSVVKLEEPSYNGIPYPSWAIKLGYFFAFIPLSPVFVCAIYQIVFAEGTLTQRINALIAPSPLWRPASSVNSSLDSGSRDGSVPSNISSKSSIELAKLVESA